MTWDLREGPWQDLMNEIGAVDAVITDPPYSTKCHEGQSSKRDQISYEPIGEKGAWEVVDSWAPRCRGWFCVLTDHVLVPHWEAALRGHGRYVFAPVPCVMRGMSVRLQGDGPSSWCVWMVVARPKDLSRWGTLPGAYVGSPSRSSSGVIGTKPLWLMRAIVRDYSNRGDLIADPFAGSGTALLAASIEGRRSVGAELDPKTCEHARKRLEQGFTKDLFAGMDDARDRADQDVFSEQDR